MRPRLFYALIRLGRFTGVHLFLRLYGPVPEVSVGILPRLDACQNEQRQNKKANRIRLESPEPHRRGEWLSARVADTYDEVHKIGNG